MKDRAARLKAERLVLVKAQQREIGTESEARRAEEESEKLLTSPKLGNSRTIKN